MSARRSGFDSGPRGVLVPSLLLVLLGLMGCGEGKDQPTDLGPPADGSGPQRDGLLVDAPPGGCSFGPSGKPGSVGITIAAPSTLDTLDATAMNTLDHERNAQLAPGALGVLRIGPCGSAGLLLRSVAGASAKLFYVDPTAGPTAPREDVEPQASTARHDASLFFDAACQPLVLRASKATGYLEYRREASNWVAHTVQADFSALLGGAVTSLRHVASDVGADGKLHVFAQAEAGGKAWLLLGSRLAAAGSNWTFEALPAPTATQLFAYRVDSGGRPHLLFRNTVYPCDPCNVDFLHATLPSGASSWTEEVVQPGKWGAPNDELVEAADLAFADDGSPLIAAQFAERVVTGSYVRTELRLYGKRNGQWCSDGIALANDGYLGGDGAKFTGASPQLVRDGAGHLHLLFSDQAVWHDASGMNAVPGQLRYALRVGDAWLLRTLFTQSGQLASKNPLTGLVQPVLAVSADGTKVIAAGVATSWQTDSIYNSADHPASYATTVVSVELEFPQ